MSDQADLWEVRTVPGGLALEMRGGRSGIVADPGGGPATDGASAQNLQS
jgi:hypothetical protein